MVLELRELRHRPEAKVANVDHGRGANAIRVCRLVEGLELVVGPQVDPLVGVGAARLAELPGLDSRFLGGLGLLSKTALRVLESGKVEIYKSGAQNYIFRSIFVEIFAALSQFSTCGFEFFLLAFGGFSLHAFGLAGSDTWRLCFLDFEGDSANLFENASSSEKDQF